MAYHRELLYVLWEDGHEFKSSNMLNWEGRSRRDNRNADEILPESITDKEAAQRYFETSTGQRNPEAKVLIFDHDRGSGHMFIQEDGRAIQI